MENNKKLKKKDASTGSTRDIEDELERTKRELERVKRENEEKAELLNKARLVKLELVSTCFIPYFAFHRFHPLGLIIFENLEFSKWTVFL